MSIENRNLKAGTHLVGRHHKQSHTCEVIQSEGDKLRYRLEDDREFKSPSAAGMAITGHACDGWVFWSLAPAEVAQNPPAQEVINPQPETAAETAAEKDAAKKSFKRTPNQRGVSEGQIRWYCQECGESFMAPYGEIPMACPMGHKA
jgi:hypothetical protein